MPRLSGPLEGEAAFASQTVRHWGPGKGTGWVLVVATGWGWGRGRSLRLQEARGKVWRKLGREMSSTTSQRAAAPLEHRPGLVRFGMHRFGSLLHRRERMHTHTICMHIQHALLLHTWVWLGAAGEARGAGTALRASAVRAACLSRALGARVRALGSAGLLQLRAGPESCGDPSEVPSHPP